MTESAGRWSDLERPPLRQGALRRALLDGEPGSWRAVELVAATGSTNADLAARARAGEPEGLVLVTDHQVAGRGRLGRDWVSPPRAGLVGKCGTVGNADPFIFTYCRIFMAGRAHRTCYQRRSD